MISTLSLQVLYSSFSLRLFVFKPNFTVNSVGVIPKALISSSVISKFVLRIFWKLLVICKWCPELDYNCQQTNRRPFFWRIRSFVFSILYFSEFFTLNYINFYDLNISAKSIVGLLYKQIYEDYLIIPQLFLMYVFYVNIHILVNVTNYYGDLLNICKTWENCNLT